MTAYNSSAGSNPDDADLTMIDPSFLYRDNDQPTSNSVVEHLKHANQSTTSKSKNSNNRNDYMYVEHDRLEAAKQIEQILNYYRQDLKQESNTQLDCNQRLIIRLVDFIRPIYSSQTNKLEDLDALLEEISVSQAIRFIEQKEKTEQLNNEILHLKKLIITSANEDDHSKNTMTKVYRINSMVSYQQWMEMEEETRKLHNLVEIQRDRINELIKIISQEDETPVGKQQPTTFNSNPENPPVVFRVPASTDQRQTTGTNIFQTDEFHSSGSSPIHSLTDFLTQSLVDKVNNETQNAERSTIAASKLPLLSRISSYHDIKRCPICDHEFLKTTNYFEISTHVERCLNPSDIDNSVPIESKQNQCPFCNQQFPADDEVYIQHLTECYYNFNRSVPSIKQNVVLQSIRICPLCQSIFNILSMDEQQFQQHVKAHSHQKPR